MLGRPPAIPAPDLSGKGPATSTGEAGRALDAGSFGLGALRLLPASAAGRETFIPPLLPTCCAAGPVLGRVCGGGKAATCTDSHGTMFPVPRARTRSPGFWGAGSSGLGLKGEAEILCRGWVGRTRWGVCRGRGERKRRLVYNSGAEASQAGAGPLVSAPSLKAQTGWRTRSPPCMLPFCPSSPSIYGPCLPWK